MVSMTWLRTVVRSSEELMTLEVSARARRRPISASMFSTVGRTRSRPSRRLASAVHEARREAQTGVAEDLFLRAEQRLDIGGQFAHIANLLGRCGTAGRHG